MPRLTNDRHELYATMRARGMLPKAAGAAAGFVAGSSTPHQLEKDPEVEARIQELTDEFNAKREAMREAASEAAKVVGQMTGVSKAWVIQKLAENAQNAAQDGDYKESNAALKLIGDEYGMFKGVSAEGTESKDGKLTFDLDQLEAVLQPAARIEAPKVESSRDMDPTVALDLIAGNGTAAKRMREARELTTGSETDGALSEDADVDAVPDGPWSNVDPETYVDDDEDTPQQPLPGPDTEDTPSDDRPKRRSSR